MIEVLVAEGEEGGKGIDFVFAFEDDSVIVYGIDSIVLTIIGPKRACQTG